jgi:hypothetical protein
MPAMQIESENQHSLFPFSSPFFNLIDAYDETCHIQIK